MRLSNLGSRGVPRSRPTRWPRPRSGYRPWRTWPDSYGPCGAGYIAHHTGHPERAVDYYQHALTLRRALGNAYQSVDALDNLGHSHVALGQYERARLVWQEAQRLYQRRRADAHAARIQRQLDDLDHQAPAS
jgi:tetratricopeptide (TPR) repeat protein